MSGHSLQYLNMCGYSLRFCLCFIIEYIYFLQLQVADFISELLIRDVLYDNFGIISIVAYIVPSDGSPEHTFDGCVLVACWTHYILFSPNFSDLWEKT